MPATDGRAERQQMAQSLSPKQFPVLTDDQVHVWRIPLNHSPERTSLSLEILSPDERQRASRFHFDKDRNQFVQARAAQKSILSKYLKVRPQELEFSYGAQGKPALANINADSELRFNLSRRDGLALLAVCRGREIGVDVELVRTGMSLFEIAEISFSARELTTLRGLPESLQASAFYNCWTRKEAYVKARGEGLSFPLKQFDVSLAPGDSVRLLQVRDNLDDVDRWTLQEIPVGENYVAALIVEGANLKVTCRDWGWSS